MNKNLLKILFFINLLAVFLIPQRLLLATAPDAILRLGYDDGIHCYLNNIEVINSINEVHGVKYWNREITNLGNHLRVGRNLIACRVSNGNGNAGTGFGGFDLELAVGGQTIISRSSSGWKYYGYSHSTTIPPADANGRNWYDVNYNDGTWSSGTTPLGGVGKDILSNAPDDAWFRKSFYLDSSWNISDFTVQTCSFYTNRLDCLNRSNCTWTGSNCIESSNISCSSFTTQVDCINRPGCAWTNTGCTSAGILSCSYFNTRVSCLSNAGCFWTGSYCLNSYLATCSSFNNQVDCLSKSGCSWINSKCVDTQYFYNQELFKIRTQSLTGCWQPTIHRLDTYLKPPIDNISGLVLESPKPLITGLLKYGNQIEVFVDEQSVGKAVVKEGEKSGVANFYFKPKESIAPTTTTLTTHQLKIVATNPNDKSVCTTGPINFIVTPYPAPIIHRLGEIPFLPRANRLSIKTKKPLITGLVKYGSVVDIFINEKFVGRAKVKEGEKSGCANFYFTLKNPLNIGEYTLYAVARKAGQEDIFSAPSQVFNFTVE